jgi:uncharacterized protein (DUF1499 family)
MLKHQLIYATLTLCLLACSGSNPVSEQGAMAPCPESPNCVSSREDGDAAIEAFELNEDAPLAWPEITQSVKAMPRTKIVEQSPGYLHAEAKSLIFRFVDDLELELLSDGKTIDIRSASRTGYSDMGVNRERVENLRKTLQEKNIIQ